jgi:hypothetical protein
LQIAFGLGCFWVWPIAMAICHRLAPKHFWLVVLACGTGCLNTEFVAVGQHIFTHALFWPVCFAIIFVRPLTPFAAAVLLGAAIILLKSYETMIFFGPALGSGLLCFEWMGFGFYLS